MPFKAISPVRVCPSSPNPFMAIRRTLSRACWGQGRDGGWDSLIRDCEKAVTHAYSCPNNPQQNIYTVHEINNLKDRSQAISFCRSNGAHLQYCTHLRTQACTQTSTHTHMHAVKLLFAMMGDSTLYNIQMPYDIALVLGGMAWHRTRPKKETTERLAKPNSLKVGNYSS